MSLAHATCLAIMKLKSRSLRTFSFTRLTNMRRASHICATCALETMRSSSRFTRHLCGPVLAGNAGRYTVIDLHLFTDDAKDVEFFMLDSKLEYRVRGQRVQPGKLPDTVFICAVRPAAAKFEISLFAHHNRRVSLRASADGRLFRRAGPDSVEAMLSQTQSGLTD